MTHRESEFLDPPDVRKLAGGASTLDAQVKALQAEGIPFRVVEKRVLVSRYHARQWLAGEAVTPTRRPNMAAAA